MGSIAIFNLVLCPCLLLRFLVAAVLHPQELCLLVAVLQLCHALTLTPGEQTGQRSSPLLMLTLCSCSKKKSFSIALGHILVVLEMH